MSQSTLSKNGQAALYYAQKLGWPVFPCKSRDKAPLSQNGFKNATLDPHIIGIWWKHWPEANIGIPTGSGSGFDVLDVDDGGEETLAELETDFGRLPNTVEAKTGGGGRHILFVHQEGVANSVKTVPGLDKRGEGGYIIVAPSIHESGREYIWELSSRPGEVQIADWPNWLLEALQTASGNGKEPAPAVGDEIPGGERNATLMSLAGSMRRRGMGEEEILAALLTTNQNRCRPPLSDDEVGRVAASVCRYEPSEQFGKEKKVAENSGKPTRETVEPCPLNAFSEPLRRVVEEGAAALQCPPDLLAVPLLVMAGAAIGNTCCLRLKRGWQELPSLYAAVVAPPGTTKTPALRLVSAPVRKQADRLRQRYEQQLVEYEAERNRAEQSKGAVGLPVKPRTERVVVSDATVEALSQVLAENPRGLLLCRDELSGWAQSMNAYKGGKGSDRQFFLSVWSGVSSSVDRKKQDQALFMDRPFLAITGAIQPDTVRSLVHDAQWDDGFLDRILFAYPNPIIPDRWTDDAVSVETESAIERLFENLFGLSLEPDGPSVVDLDDSGKKLWIEWYNHHQSELKDVAENLRGPWAKMPNQCGRLILIAHLTRWAAGEAVEKQVADQISVARGSTLVEYFKSHARRIVNVLGADAKERTVRRLIEWIERKGNPGVSPRVAAQAGAGGIKKAEDARALLDVLVERREGEWRPGEVRSSGQREAKKFFLLK
ncbi:MAG: DUF3987 domain-containing protein [Gemmatimonadetes bacterium]|nr:DUF3987 domain-containing protein [Gemmatimonadota bacterium]